jgi:hypothetical protein
VRGYVPGAEAMITCYLLDGIFQETSVDNFHTIASSVNRHRRKLSDLPLDLIIETLSQLGRKILQDKAINQAPGITYLSLWLKRKNLEEICRRNYADFGYPDGFVPVNSHLSLAARPRGIICHWIAANVPTLAFFSIVQALLSKNGSIVKVPEENRELVLAILKDLSVLDFEYRGTRYSGEILLNVLSIVTFEGRDGKTSEQFSLIADGKIIYGSSEAVRSVIALPQRDHCEVIVFGPKYSFGVFDRESVEGSGFKEALDKTVKDIAVFNQMACSSPHVIFFEKNRFTLYEIGMMMKESFDSLPPLLRHQATPPSTLADTINIRGKFLLSEDKQIIIPEDMGWTILMDKELQLEEPVQGKCIFIKEIARVEDCLPLVTRKIQAMIVSICDPYRSRAFAGEATYLGVDRIVAPGRIHEYNQPWDGILSLNRLVRWVIISKDR